MSLWIHTTATHLVPASALITVGWVLLWIVVGLLGLAGLIVLLPVHLRAAGEVDDLRLAGHAHLRWAWGVVSVRLTPERGATLHVLGLRLWTFRVDGDKKDKPKKPNKGRARGSLQWFLRYRQTGLRLVKRLLGTLRLQLSVQGALGLGDPSSTALMNQLLNELDRMSDSVQLRVEPDWLEERVELDGELRARLWLAHIGWVLLGALTNRETRQMIRTVPRSGR